MTKHNDLFPAITITRITEVRDNYINNIIDYFTASFMLELMGLQSCEIESLFEDWLHHYPTKDEKHDEQQEKL